MSVDAAREQAATKSSGGSVPAPPEGGVQPDLLLKAALSSKLTLTAAPMVQTKVRGVSEEKRNGSAPPHTTPQARLTASASPAVKGSQGGSGRRVLEEIQFRILQSLISLAGTNGAAGLSCSRCHSRNESSQGGAPGVKVWPQTPNTQSPQ